MIRPIVHYSLHFVIPLVVILIFFPKQWKKLSLIFLLSMLVDLDHLLATPVFEADRCSINFHPLHSYIAFFGYAIMLLFPKTRVLGIALLWHMITDQIDCWMM
ncbi:DUF6122 family protein [Aquimarina spongiae]|uniref:DUF6122 family protein n=1 Tax=Aquimarina spongiae TaxID=570521 RepID=UPI0009344B85|nr:DUF6122 family protein [Aquimarina spongiae]